MVGIQIYCSCCGKMFCICKDCFRNNKYCSDECREAGYRESHRIAQRKYSSKEDVKKKHAENEAKRRKKKKGELKRKLKNQLKICMCIMMLIDAIYFQFDPIRNNGVCTNCGEKIDKIVEYREPLDDKKNCFD